MRWTLEMFLWELRSLFSFSLLLYMWYGMGLLDYYLHYLFTKELKKVVKLPVEIDFISCYLSGKVVVKGIHIYTPPIEEDNRWELSHIVTVDSVAVQFPFFISLIFFVLSNGELVITDVVKISGVRFYVEGYRTPIANDGTTEHSHNHSKHGHHYEDVFFNVSLIGKQSHGKRSKIRKNKTSTKRSSSSEQEKSVHVNEKVHVFEGKESPQLEKEIKKKLDDSEGDESDEVDQKITDYGMKTMKLEEDYFQWRDSDHSPPPKSQERLSNDFPSSTGTDTVADSARTMVEASVMSQFDPQAVRSHSTASATSTLTSTTAATHLSNSSHGSTKRASFSSYFHDTYSHLKTRAKEIQEKIHDSGGIYNATKQRLVHVYEKTKQSIDATVQDKIIQLHLYLSGYEPLPAEEMARVICGHCIFDYMEIHMLRALPPQIRHLESKPLVVERLEFFEIGYDHLNFLRSTAIPPQKETVSEVKVSEGTHSSGEFLERSFSHRSSFSEISGLSDLKGKRPSRGSGSGEKLLSSSFPLSSISERIRSEGRGVQPPQLRSISIRHNHPGLRGLTSPASSPLPAATALEAAFRDLPNDVLTSETTSSCSLAIPVKPSLPPHIQIIEEDHSHGLIDLFSIDPFQSGLDAMIFKYHFERKILYALYKSNAGRVINDFFTISNWIGGHGSHGNTQPHHPSPSQTASPVVHPSSPSTSTSLPPTGGGPNRRTSFERPSVASNPLASHQQVVITHPIFFET